MGFVTSSRLQRRWPFGRVPYEISDSLGAVARTAITNAINAWQATAPVQFVPHGDEADYVVFELAPGSCFSQVGRIGGRQSISCSLPTTPVAAPNGALSIAQQIDDQRDCVIVGADGAVYVAYTTGPAVWSDFIGI